MFIYDDIVLQRTADGTRHLHISAPVAWIGQLNNRKVGHLGVANNVGDQDFLATQLGAIQAAEEGDQEYAIPLADRTSNLRGRGAGLALVGMVGGKPRIYFPKRDSGAPGDRFIWDANAGRTTHDAEHPDWLHLMLQEGFEETTFVYNGKLLVPDLESIPEYDHRQIFNIGKITESNAEVLGLTELPRESVPFKYFGPRNGVTVHEQCHDGEGEVTFVAGWGVEPVYSGLELFGYGVMSLGNDPEKLVAHDGETFAPGKLIHRETHELDPSSGRVRVFHKGNVVREHLVVNEVSHRAEEVRDYLVQVAQGDIRERAGLVPPPGYMASVKADGLTTTAAWPFDTPLGLLERVVTFEGNVNR